MRIALFSWAALLVWVGGDDCGLAHLFCLARVVTTGPCVGGQTRGHLASMGWQVPCCASAGTWYSHFSTISIDISLQSLTVVTSVSTDFAIGCTEVILIPLGSKRSMKVSIYGDLRQDKMQDLFACAESDVASWSLLSPPHALSLVIVRPSQDHVNSLIDGLNMGLGDQAATHRLRLVLTAYVVELALRRRAGHHGH